MKLYHCKDSRSLRALWTLEELRQEGGDVKLECEVQSMQFPPRALEPGYLDVNPLGTVPTLVDGDVTLTESSGICHYLVERYGPTRLGVYKDEPQYGEFLNWMYRSDATLTFPQTLVLRYTRLEPEERRNPQVVEDYSKWYLSRLRSVEQALEGKQWLCADRFTIADIAVGYALFFGSTLGLDERYKPNCKRYLEDLMNRPALIRARSI